MHALAASLENELITGSRSAFCPALGGTKTTEERKWKMEGEKEGGEGKKYGGGGEWKEEERTETKEKKRERKGGKKKREPR